MTFATAIVYGGGTGTIGSPAAFCEAGPDGSVVDRLSDRIGSLSDPAWTRDGTRLAFVAYDVAARRSAIQVTGAGSWNPRSIVRGPVRWPAWSPDGSRIAYVSSSADHPGLYIANADGSGGRLIFAGRAASPSWSPDGARIAFEADGVRVANADGGGLLTVASDGVTPAWSPDGGHIAFVATVPGATPLLAAQELFVAAPDGGARTQISHLVEPSTSGPIETTLSRPAWSLDGSQIAVARAVSFRFVKGSFALSRDLFLLDAGGSAQTKLLSLDGIGDPAWRPAPPLTKTDATSRPCTILSDGRRTLRGTSYDDLIVGGDAGESILGGAGNDWIHGGAGRDTVTGGPGADEIWTGRGSDVVLVRDGLRDVVHCGEARSDTGKADRRDLLLGSCRRVERG